MDKIFSLLQSLFSLTKVASITLPGLISAGALAYLMRPTPPADFIPDFVINAEYFPHARPTYATPIPANPGAKEHQDQSEPDVSAKLSACRDFDLFRITTKEAVDARREYLRSCLPPAGPVCRPNIRAGAPQIIELGRIAGSTFRHRRDLTTENQRLLEEAKQKVAFCINIEQNWQGIENIQNEMFRADITFFQKELSTAQDNLLAQQKVNGLLAGNFRTDVFMAQNEINIRRDRILYNEQSTNNRKASLGELKRIDDVISARLADPGRLRPIQPFDDYLNALVGHVVAFVLLALAIGVVIDPLGQSITAACFDAIFPRGF